MWLSACENDPADIEALAKKFRTDIETAKGVEILYSDSAQLKVRIEGEIEGSRNHRPK